jgi:hypothetical protein
MRITKSVFQRNGCLFSPPRLLLLRFTRLAEYQPCIESVSNIIIRSDKTNNFCHQQKEGIRNE